MKLLLILGCFVIIQTLVHAQEKPTNGTLHVKQLTSTGEFDRIPK
jgi:hypothetical protein